MGLESEYANCKTLYVLPPAGYNTQESNVPVMVRIGRSAGKYRDDTSDVFEKLGASYQKMAVSLDDGVTECPVEVTEWDVDRQLGILFVKIPSVPTTGMTLKLWYDPTHTDNPNVGGIGSVAGRSVWTNGFEGVWHMKMIPVTKKTLYAGEVSGSAPGGAVANAAVTFSPINCTGLTKGNGWLKIDLKCDLPENLTDGSQLEITSAGGPDTQEWTLVNVHGTYGISTEWRTYYLPLSSAGTGGGELDPARINYIRWYVLMADGAPATTISWRNAEIVSTANLPDGMNVPLLLDSTRNQNHGMIYGATEVDSPLGRCLSFDGVDDYVNCGANALLELGDLISVDICMKIGIPSTGAYFVLSKEGGFRVFADGSRLAMCVWGSGSDIPSVNIGHQNRDTNSYEQSTFVADQGILSSYHNGIKYGSATYVAPRLISPQNLVIGASSHLGGHAPMECSEIRLSSVARSPAWIALTHASLKDELIAFSTPRTESLIGNERMRLKPDGTLIANEFVEV